MPADFLARRREPPSLAQFLIWARHSRAGDWCQYYEGNLALDRTRNDALARVAETVWLFTETRYLTVTQRPVPGDADGATAYLAFRIDAGFAPRAVLAGEMPARHYTSLRAIRTRDPALSAQRALRYALGASETAAEAMLRELEGAGHIERAAGGGWTLSAGARRLVV